MSTWANILKKAGLTVVDKPVDGRPLPYGPPRGILLHHTGGKAPGDLRVVTKGRADLPGPLAQFYVDPDGVWHVVTTGRANHAGTGSWNKNGLYIPKDRGNQFLIGIEISSPGTAITGAQYNRVIKGVAALCIAYKWDANKVIRHHDYAGPRKDDIKNDLTKVRADITKSIAAQKAKAGASKPAATKPATSKPAVAKSTWPLPVTHAFGLKPSKTVHNGSANAKDKAAVKKIQAKFKNLPVTGFYGNQTTAKVRAWQVRRLLPPTGRVGQREWNRLGL